MSKLFLDLRLSEKYDRKDMTDVIRAICNQLNSLSEGQIQARYQAQTSHPTTNAAVSYAKGDIVWNSDPTELGSVAPGIAAKYVLAGWECTSSGKGSGAVFKEMRWLTGN